MHTIKLKSIGEIKKLLSCRNQILVKRKYKNEEQRTASGIYIITDVTFRPALHADRIGEVVLVPDGLFYHSHDYRDYPFGGESMPWNCDLELEVGDTVVHTFMERDDIVNIEVEDEPGELYRMMPYDDIYVAKRKIMFDRWVEVATSYSGSPFASPFVIMNGIKYGAQKEGDDLYAIIPLNGYSLCEEVKKEKPSKIIETVEEKDIDQKVGKVAYMGRPNRAYRVGGAGERDLDGGSEISPGDIIIKRRGDIHIRLEEDLHNRFFDTPVMYFIIQRKDIMGVRT